MEEITRCLRGHNGDAGLVAEIKDNTDFRKEFQGTLKKILYALVASIITAVGSGMINLLRK